MDINHPYYHQFETNKSHWAVDYWLRRHGVTSRDLDTHPQINDMIVLLNIRESLWDLMSQSERNCWGAYWGLVYVKKYPLTRKFWNKFQNIANQIDIRQHKKQIRQQQVRQHLRTLKNKDHDNEAKGSDLAQKLADKSNNRGAAMSLHQ